MLTWVFWIPRLCYLAKHEISIAQRSPHCPPSISRATRYCPFFTTIHRPWLPGTVSRLALFIFLLSIGFSLTSDGGAMLVDVSDATLLFFYSVILYRTIRLLYVSDIHTSLPSTAMPSGLFSCPGSLPGLPVPIVPSSS